MSWLDDLEARLERELETFLAANPDQEALLRDQEDRDRQAHLRSQRRGLQQQAERQRQGLLQLASQIRQWQERTDKARDAGASDLAERAEQHVGELMQQGRRRWQELEALGQRFAAVEQELLGLASRQARSRAGDGPSLERDWAAFEAQQELEELRRRQG
ncbi:MULTISPECIES: hercynine metabolism protein [Aphanothece]|uniref:hercynine metabolism protein n=1 Tax=Aphanothece TaxID=1121 RepID=UPI003985602C